MSPLLRRVYAPCSFGTEDGSTSERSRRITSAARCTWPITRSRTRRKPCHVPGTLPFRQVPRAGGVVLDCGEQFAQLLQQREAIRREPVVVVRRQGGQGRSFQRCGGAIVPLESPPGGERGADGVGPPVSAALWVPAVARRHGNAPRCPDPPSPLRTASFGPAVMACHRRLRQINATPFLIVHGSRGWRRLL